MSPPAQHSTAVPHAPTSSCYHEAWPPEASDARPYGMQIAAGSAVQACALGRGKSAAPVGDVCFFERREENRMGGHVVWVQGL